MTFARPAKIAAFVLLPLLVLAAGAPPTAKPPAQPVVTLTKTDGTTVKGKLLEARWDKVKLAAGKDEQEIPWHDISKISNGLTRNKALDAFRKDHADAACPDCNGFGFHRCETCKGTGHVPESAKDCPTCKGELLVDCKTPKCDKGRLPCPNTCLKRGEGNWIMRDGKKVREFKSGSKTFWWSENHLGELIVREGTDYVDKGKCPTCGGTTTIPDPACLGAGKLPCPDDVKRDAPACKDCQFGDVACKACTGTGVKPTTP